MVEVIDISSQDYVERDLMLIKVKASPGRARSEVRELVEIFRGKIVDVGAEELMIEISGRENKIDAFIERMRTYGIIELVRNWSSCPRTRRNEHIRLLMPWPLPWPKPSNLRDLSGSVPFNIDVRLLMPFRFSLTSSQQPL